MAGCLAISSSCTNGNGENSSSTAKKEVPPMLDRTFVTGTDTEREELLTSYDKAILTLETNPGNLQQYNSCANIYP